MQVKSYSKLDDKRNANDKGYVSIGFGVYVKGLYKEAIHAPFFRLTLLLAFIFLNILTLVTLTKSVSLYYHSIRNRIAASESVRCLYWAAAIVAFFCNIAYVAASLTHQFTHGHPTITPCVIHLANYNCSIPSDTNIYRDEVLTLVGKLTIIPIAVFIELFVSISVVRSYYVTFYSPAPNFAWKQCPLLTVHVIALWNIQIAIQLLAMVVTPICVLLLVHPQETILLSLLIVITPVVLTLIAAYLMYQCQHSDVCCNSSNCLTTLVYFVLISAIMGLIIAIFALYETVLIVQAEIGTGVKGLVLSLLPLLPLSAIGWYIIQRCQGRVSIDYIEQEQEHEHLEA